MSVHNGEQYVEEAVASVLGQTLGDLEALIVDDGSTDGTERILRRLAAEDGRVTVIRQARSGLTAALVSGCHRVRGRYIARIDADDVALPRRLEQQIDFLERNPDVAAVGGAATFVDHAGRPFATVQYPSDSQAIGRALATGCPLVHSAVTMRSASYREVGGYRLSPRAEDYDLWLRLAERYHLANLTDVVVRYRVHLTQMSALSLREQAVCAVAARVAADRRRASREDPLERESYVSTATLRRLGIDERTVALEEFRATLWYARLLGHAGYARAAASLMANARRLALRLGRRQLARALAAQAEISSRGGHVWGARVAGLGAGLLDPARRFGRRGRGPT